MRDAGQMTGGQSPETSTEDNQNTESESQQQQSKATSEQTEELMESIKNALQREIEQGAIEVDNLGQQIVIRLQKSCHKVLLPGVGHNGFQ